MFYGLQTLPNIRHVHYHFIAFKTIPITRNHVKNFQNISDICFFFLYYISQLFLKNCQDHSCFRFYCVLSVFRQLNYNFILIKKILALNVRTGPELFVPTSIRDRPVHEYHSNRNSRISSNSSIFTGRSNFNVAIISVKHRFPYPKTWVNYRLVNIFLIFKIR